VAALAKLRHGVGLPPGADLELIGLTTAGLYPENARLPDDPTDQEHAVYAAVTLFALHQQSHRGKRMHLPRYSFGRTARLLGKHSGADEAVRRRFNALGTATTWDELIHHARGLIQQFRAHDIPLDYARFAVDLLRLRRQATASAVRNAWGRDFYRAKTEDDTDDDTSTETPTEAPAQAD
jgi:CRISPR system Cascade subunit CasB